MSYDLAQHRLRRHYAKSTFSPIFGLAGRRVSAPPLAVSAPPLVGVCSRSPSAASATPTAGYAAAVGWLRTASGLVCRPRGWVCRRAHAPRSGLVSALWARLRPTQLMR